MRYQGKWNAVVNAKCPYYQRDNRLQICCEGVEGSASLYVTCDTEEEKNKYLLEHCINYKTLCPIAAMLDEKYEDLA